VFFLSVGSVMGLTLCVLYACSSLSFWDIATLRLVMFDLGVYCRCPLCRSWTLAACVYFCEHTSFVCILLPDYGMLSMSVETLFPVSWPGRCYSVGLAVADMRVPLWVHRFCLPFAAASSNALTIYVDPLLLTT